MLPIKVKFGPREQKRLTFN